MHTLVQLSVVFVSFAVSSLPYCSVQELRQGKHCSFLFSFIEIHNGIVVCLVLCEGQGTNSFDHKRTNRHGFSLLFRPFVQRRNSNRVREVLVRLFERIVFFAGTLRYSLHKQASASLKSGLDLKEIVRLPENEDEDDWIAVHGERGAGELHDL
jgi:hypothetical protein